MSDDRSSHRADNQRKHERLRKVRAAITRFESPQSPLPCVLLDISESGARLHVHDISSLPEQFRLRVDSEGIDEHCEVVWRREEEVGVRFLKA